ncbi:MAG: hypothetical protein J3K34DRAFT_445213 [Monoraphidium minutum]|nr:MAG: hypothetical protein J3K34DRAFT_445213 [Monoraphidium minutum]
MPRRSKPRRPRGPRPWRPLAPRSTSPAQPHRPAAPRVPPRRRQGGAADAAALQGTAAAAAGGAPPWPRAMLKRRRPHGHTGSVRRAACAPRGFESGGAGGATAGDGTARAGGGAAPGLAGVFKHSALDVAPQQSLCSSIYRGGALQPEAQGTLLMENPTDDLDQGWQLCRVPQGRGSDHRRAAGADRHRPGHRVQGQPHCLRSPPVLHRHRYSACWGCVDLLGPQAPPTQLSVGGRR